MSPRSWRIRAQDILSAISEIEIYTKHSTFEDFSKDKMAIRAATACFSVIGEAVNHIPDAIKKKHPEVPWEQIKGMRNRIAHEYFSVDETVLWRTAKDRLPSFKIQLQKILDSFQD